MERVNCEEKTYADCTNWHIIEQIKREDKDKTARVNFSNSLEREAGHSKLMQPAAIKLNGTSLL